MDYQTVLAAVETLPIPERIRLLEEAWDRLPDAPEMLELGEEFKAELIRRGEELGRNPGSGIPWDAVEARLREKYRL